MIKAIFFDFDGVLTTDSAGGVTTCKYISDSAGVSYDMLRSCYKKFNSDLNFGKVTFASVWDDFCKCVGTDLDIGVLNSAFLSTSKNEEMFDLVRGLKGKFKLGVITDNNKDRFSLLVKKWGLADLFDVLVLSAEVGGLKDSEKIFEVALEKAGVSASECIFIDNKESNLVVPTKMGFKTIFFDTEKNDVAGLEDAIKGIL